MVDDHRKIEPRSIIGTGMATDPDRIRDIEAEQARRERSGSGQPKRSFATALEEEPLQRDDELTFELEGNDDRAEQKKVKPSDAPQAVDETDTESAFQLEEDVVGQTISSAELHHKLMRFKR